MTFCESRARSILAFVEDTLDSVQRERFTAHLATCEACRQAAAEHTAVKARLGELPFAPVSNTFTERILQRVSGPAWLDIANWRIWTLRLAPLAALLALLAWLPARTAISSGESVPTVLESWGTIEEADVELRMLLNPAVGPHVLLHPAIEDASR